MKKDRKALNSRALKSDVEDIMQLVEEAMQLVEEAMQLVEEAMQLAKSLEDQITLRTDIDRHTNRMIEVMDVFIAIFAFIVAFTGGLDLPEDLDALGVGGYVFPLSFQPQHA